MEHTHHAHSNYRACHLMTGFLFSPTSSQHPHRHPPPHHHCSSCGWSWWNFRPPVLSISHERRVWDKDAPWLHKDVTIFFPVASNTVAYISIKAYSKLKWLEWSLWFATTNLNQWGPWRWWSSLLCLAVATSLSPIHRVCPTRYRKQAHYSIIYLSIAPPSYTKTWYVGFYSLLLSSVKFGGRLFSWTLRRRMDIILSCLLF